MQQQHLTEEATVASAPTNHTGETVLPSHPEVPEIQHMIPSSLPTSQVVPGEVLVTTLKRLWLQSWLDALLGGIVGTLVTLFVCFLVIGTVDYQIGMFGHHLSGGPVRVLFDPSPLAFEVNATGSSQNGTTITFSGITPLAVMLVCGMLWVLVRRKRIALIHQVSRMDDVRFVGPLIEALYIQDKLLHSEVSAALTRLLPRLRTEDMYRLNANHRTLLNRYLNRSKFSLPGDDNALSLAILRAYPMIGDGTELPVVRRVAQGKGNSGKDSQLRQEAQRYLDRTKP
jgi:hypothetical protein